MGKPDDRFFPCNDRERDILMSLAEPELSMYKDLRNKGKTVSEAIELTKNGK